MTGTDVPILERENLRDSIGFLLVSPPPNEEVEKQATPIPSKGKEELLHYRNQNFVINHDHNHDLDEIPGRVLGKKPNPNMISLVNQPLITHRRCHDDD